MNDRPVDQKVNGPNVSNVQNQIANFHLHLWLNNVEKKYDQ
jgi:hypothetical protein